MPAENLGFGRACNLAFDASDSELVLLLNPDARLLPGALDTMRFLTAERPDLAAVGPRVHWDDSKRFMMPLSTFPSRSWLLRTSLGGLLPFWSVRCAGVSSGSLVGLAGLGHSLLRPCPGARPATPERGDYGWRIVRPRISSCTGKIPT